LGFGRFILGFGVYYLGLGMTLSWVLGGNYLGFWSIYLGFYYTSCL